MINVWQCPRCGRRFKVFTEVPDCQWICGCLAGGTPMTMMQTFVCYDGYRLRIVREIL